MAGRKNLVIAAITTLFLLTSAFILKFTDGVSAQNTEKTKAVKTSLAFNPYSYIDERLGEKLQPDELDATPKSAEATKAQITKARTDGSADEKGNTVFMRAAHSKAHCWITAQFKIMKDIPSDLQVGFALVDHKPLGGVNRVRFTAYKVISETRRTSNKVTSKELRGPTGREKF